MHLSSKPGAVPILILYLKGLAAEAKEMGVVVTATIFGLSTINNVKLVELGFF